MLCLRRVCCWLLLFPEFLVLSPGGDHQAKAGQGPQEDLGEESQVPPGWQREGQVQGGDNREDARVDGFLIDTIKKLLKFYLLCVSFQTS